MIGSTEYSRSNEHPLWSRRRRNFGRGSVVTKTGSSWVLVNNSGCIVDAAMWAVSSELVSTSSLKKRGAKNRTGGFSLRLTGFGQSLVQSVVHRSSQRAVTCIECCLSETPGRKAGAKKYGEYFRFLGCFFLKYSPLNAFGSMNRPEHETTPCCLQ